ncbi:MAG: hypothetical protein HYX35_03975 [Proteobacteria bacterium]|nr:hypothetical protein [Pseudomonadota bacterium]
MIRPIHFLIGILGFCSFIGVSFADDNQNDQAPVLILNAENTLTLPLHFRSTNTLKLTTFPSNISSTGLQNVPMSGSAQFSQLQLITMLAQLPSPLVIIDLRQESHGFINDGLAISWYSYRDWANVKDSLLTVLATEEDLLKGLLTKKSAEVSQLTKKFMVNPSEVHKEILAWQTLDITSAFTELQLTGKVNVGYFRLPITDHLKPNDETVDTFLLFFKKLPPNTWIHFHCAAGDGRTTTLMTMYDIIKNAKKVSWQDIVSRQGFIGPLNLAKMPDPQAWNYKFFKERIEFIEKFHKYILEVGESFNPLWSEWAKKNS